MGADVGAPLFTEAECTPAPEKPGFVEVNDCRVLMTGDHTVTEWWLLYRSRAEAAGRVKVLGVGIGDLVRIACETKADAEWLAGHMVSHGGLPRSAVKANGSLPRGVAGRERRLEGG